uniref:TetR family transcriptional regulator n=1 Tax=Streptomyces sp. CNQ-418 TaxID=467194 RepID=J7GY96_9ACTN|nr:TetR family transcriptional regulator [Streptomyces sp. CNQ-418]
MPDKLETHTHGLDVAKTPASRRSGRRPGESQSRDAILRAARELFSEQGFSGTTIRAIARRAGVDPALVYYFFPNKDGVWSAVIEDVIGPLDVLGPALKEGRDNLAERLVAAYLTPWEGEHGETLVAISRSTMAKGAEHPISLLTDPGRLARTIGGTGAQLRASLILSQLHGVAVQRYVFRMEPLASVSVDRVSRWLAPSLRVLIEPNEP